MTSKRMNNEMDKQIRNCILTNISPRTFAIRKVSWRSLPLAVSPYSLTAVLPAASLVTHTFHDSQKGLNPCVLGRKRRRIPEQNNLI